MDYFLGDIGRGLYLLLYLFSLIYSTDNGEFSGGRDERQNYWV
jgi:hypothetical protein